MNTAPEGSSIAFELNEQTGFCWKGACDATVDDVLNGTGKVQTKTMLMEEELKRMLSGRVPAEEVQKKAKAMGVSKRTLDIAPLQPFLSALKLPPFEATGGAVCGFHDEVEYWPTAVTVVMALAMAALLLVWWKSGGDWNSLSLLRR